MCMWMCMCVRVFVCACNGFCDSKMWFCLSHLVTSSAFLVFSMLVFYMLVWIACATPSCWSLHFACFLPATKAKSSCMSTRRSHLVSQPSRSAPRKTEHASLPVYCSLLGHRSRICVSPICSGPRGFWLQGFPCVFRFSPNRAFDEGFLRFELFPVRAAEGAELP